VEWLTLLANWSGLSVMVLHRSLSPPMSALESPLMPPTFTSFLVANTHHSAREFGAVALPCRPWPRWILFMLLALLVAAPASTKAAGAAWLLVVLVGLWAALCLPVVHAPSCSQVRSSQLWLVVCLIALALQAVVTWYWTDPWGDRHVEIRLLLGAAACFSLMHRLRFLPQQKIWLTHALALACWVAFVVTYLNGRMTPTNPIPWAAGVSFFVCLLLPLALQPHITRWQKMAWGLAVLAGVAAVLLSLSRGSYGLLLWVAGVAVFQQLRQGRRTQSAGVKSVMSWFGGAAVAVVLLVVLLPGFSRNYEASVGRIQLAWGEMKSTNESGQPQAQAINTSVGARLHMWRMALKPIGENLLFGHGRKERIAWIHQLGQAEGSETIQKLDHLHSDPLTTLFDHGLFGLTSYLGFGAGLAWFVLRRTYCSQTLRWSLAGVLWMHLTSGLTNMNFGHNYYGVMLALSLLLAWMLAADGEMESQAQKITEKDIR
jgi:O-antigen ligase